MGYIFINRQEEVLEFLKLSQVKSLIIQLQEFIVIVINITSL